MTLIISIILFALIIEFLRRSSQKTLKDCEAGKNNWDDDRAEKFVSIVKWVRIAGYALSFIAIAMSSFVVVSTGNTGIKKVFGVVVSSLDPGLHLIEPWSNVDELSVQTRDYTMVTSEKEGKVVGNDAMTILSSDGLPISVEMTILYRVSKNKAVKLVSDVGLDYENIIIRPVARSATREAGAMIPADGYFSEKKAIFKKNIIDFLTPRYEERGIILEDVLIRGIVLPKVVSDAIQEKLKMQQESQKMVFTLQKEKQEAERKRIEAIGIRDFQSTVSSGIDEKLLEWKAIETMEKIILSNTSKVFVFGRQKDGIPMLMDK